MSLFDLQDVCIAIGSLATLDLPMVVDLIGIYGLKGPYCTLTTTNWFLQALSVIPRGSWGDVARRSYHDPMGKPGIVIPEPQWLSSSPCVDKLGGADEATSAKVDTDFLLKSVWDWKWAEICVDIVQFSLFGHLLPVGTYNLCTYIVAVGTVIDLEADQTGFFGVFQRGLDANMISSSSSSSRSENLNPSSHSSSIDCPMHFTVDDIPEISSSDEVLPIEETTVVTPQISLPTVVPSTDYTEAFAQLRATVDQISLEQVQTRFHIYELKAALSKKISNLETTSLTASDNQDRVVLVQNNVLLKEMQVQKAALSKELDDI
ncbi:myosin-11-like [Dorcoceras hygrometricum]|uniref:Myosin-11-like n=1 Tax=Dorcoceras hygrometricum TaxID=472368 RepID=A0A2Z7AH90_9LAMI|nr:myosin-11-like [Dorcoceras hygrometricum]